MRNHVECWYRFRVARSNCCSTCRTNSYPQYTETPSPTPRLIHYLRIPSAEFCLRSRHAQCDLFAGLCASELFSGRQKTHGRECFCFSLDASWNESIGSRWDHLEVRWPTSPLSFSDAFSSSITHNGSWRSRHGTAFDPSDILCWCDHTETSPSGVSSGDWIRSIKVFEKARSNQ